MTLEKGQSRGSAHRQAQATVSADPLVFLANSEIDQDLLAEVRSYAEQHEIPVSEVLFSQNIISQADYVRRLADYHGLTCLCEPSDLEGYEPDRVKGLKRLEQSGMLKETGLLNLVRDGEMFVALDVLHYEENILGLFFEKQQVSRERLLLITPEMKRHLMQRDQDGSRLHRAIHGLGERFEGLSAREKTTYPQKLVLSFLFGLLAGGLVLSPIGTLYVLGGALNIFFLYSLLLRLYAASTLATGLVEGGPLEGVAPLERVFDEQLPIYTILVPLFREHRVVGQLIDNLLALDYPRDKLDIKLIFEENDEVTIAAARACAPPTCFEFVIVPSAQPQTKPKALNYALSGARGHYVVVYDAEDRPDTDQLRKAVAVFEQANEVHLPGEGDRPLACLQAGLNHYNIDENWLARQFTIEYTSLFDGLLPALQRLDLPIPLGGTSNHFRTDVLEKIGGWDAFNVTEDADLGIRLMRFGYRCGVLSSTTYEEACCRPRDWVCQRTRWLKGWLQTYLVHMRHPVTLFRDLGARGFAGFQIILGAQVLSLVAHPIFIVFMISEAWRGHLFEMPYGVLSTVFWVLAIGNFILGYTVAIWLGFATLKRRAYGRLYGQLFLMPVYWLLISFATFRALVHYVVKPFHWEKTEHGLGAPDPKKT